MSILARVRAFTEERATSTVGPGKSRYRTSRKVGSGLVRLPRLPGLASLREGFQKNFKAVHNLSRQFAGTSLGENLVAGAVHLKEVM